MNNKVGIIGGGSWGTALAIVLSSKNIEVDMWLRDSKQCIEIQNNRINKKYLPNVHLSDEIKVTNNIDKVILDNNILILSIPTHGIRNKLEELKNKIKENQVIVNVAKGIENESLECISQIVKEILPNNKYVMLSGPSHAEEVALKKPTTIIAASEDINCRMLVQDLFMTSNFRVYTNSDVVGVELGGALKNVIALGAGISDGLGYGDNAKAALLNRGIFEIARLGKAMGGKLDTFFGLSGVGDLIVTCTSIHSRNRKAGLLIGEGKSVEEAIKEVGMVVEGIKTTKSAYELSKKYNVEMPITEEIYNIIYKNEDVQKAVKRLMTRDKKYEMADLI